MNQEQYKKLEQFFHGKGARQRVVLYFVAYGYSASEILAMTVSELRAATLPVDMQVYRDEMLYGHTKDSAQTKRPLAFVYPSGNPMSVPDCKRLVKETTEKVLGIPMSLEAFRSYIKSTKRGK